MKKEIQEAIEKAERSEGYLIMITRLHSGDKLEHIYFTRTFRRDDIMPSLDEHSRLLETEANPPKVEVTEEKSKIVEVAREKKEEDKPLKSL